MRRLRAIERQLREIHAPTEEEVELWGDGDHQAEHDRRFPLCRDCDGHTYTIQVCTECGYEHNGEYPIFRPWPCPTIKALDE